MQFEQEGQTSLTEVQLLDFSPETYVNFEAEVHFPEDEDIVQIENMGVHVDHQGSVVYGCERPHKCLRPSLDSDIGVVRHLAPREICPMCELAYV